MSPKFHLAISSFILAIVFQHCICGDIEEMMQALHEACVQSIGVSEDLIKQGNAPGDLPNDPLLKCYMKCLMSEVGLMDEAGVFDADAFIDMIPDDHKTWMAPVIEKCKSETGTDPCDIAYNMNVCFKKERPDKYILT